MKFLSSAIGLFCLVAPAAAQDQPPIAGNYKQIAACVYKAFDGFIPGSFRLTDLVDDVELSLVIPIRGVPVRTMKATFHKAADDVTALAVEDEGAASQRLYPVRSIATRCASAS
jgi:hypothetical protein